MKSSGSYRIGSGSSIASAMRQRTKRGRKALVASLMLTPMVDMFSLLVIFLLQFFNNAPDLQLTKDIELPSSISSTETKDVPVVSISQEEVFVDHALLGPRQEILDNPLRLAQQLHAVQAKWVANHPGQEFLGEINLEAHQSLESTQISQFMAILAAQHFGSIQLVALGD